jgi:hypothetical protein
MTCSRTTLAEDLALLHAEHLAGFILADRDGLDAAAVNLREIAGVVDRERDQRRQEPSVASPPQSWLPNTMPGPKKMMIS